MVRLLALTQEDADAGPTKSFTLRNLVNPRTLLSSMLAAALAFTSLVITPAYAAEERLSVSSFPSEFVVGDPNAVAESLQLTVRVESSARQRVVVEFIDFFVSDDGQRSQLPADTTPYSLAKVLKIQPFDDLYPGDGSIKTFTVEIVPLEDYRKSLFLGGISVRLEGQGEENQGVATAGAIVRNLTVSPFGIAATLDEGTILPAKVVRHDLERLARSSFIDSVLPDLPGVVNFGPVESTVIVKTDGEFPVFSSIYWEFVHQEKVVASKRFASAVVGPGQEVLKSVSTQVTGESDGVLLNVLPSTGLVSNQITISSTLGGTDLPVQTYDGSFLVLQWKEPFVAVVLVYFLVRWAWRKNLSKRQKDETASLGWLALQQLARNLQRKKTSSETTSTPN